MAFNSKNTVITNQPQQSISNPQTPPNSPELELEELDFLLRVLGNADLKGHQIEMFYNMTIKLQNLYLQKAK